MVQLERDRLFKRNQLVFNPMSYLKLYLIVDLGRGFPRCPTHFELRLRFNDTLFGQLCALIENIDQGWTLINSVALINRLQ